MSASPRAESPSKQLLESLDQSLFPETPMLPSVASVLAEGSSPFLAAFRENYEANPRVQKMRSRGKIDISSESSKPSPQSPPNISRRRREPLVESPQEERSRRPTIAPFTPMNRSGIAPPAGTPAVVPSPSLFVQRTPVAPRATEEHVLLEHDMCCRCIRSLGSTDPKTPETICELSYLNCSARTDSLGRLGRNLLRSRTQPIHGPYVR